MANKFEVSSVISNEQINETIFLMRSNWTHGANAGQFFMLRAWDKNPLLSRPISVHDSGEDWVEFLYEVKGEGTMLLSKLKKGDTIELTGAAGNGFPINDISGKVAVVGGGIGVAPLYKTVSELKAKNCTVDFFCGFRDKPYTLEKFEAICDNIYLATDSGNYGVKGFVTDLLNPEDYDFVLTCGPEIMMEKIARKSIDKGITVFVSKESHMACGIGACLGCTCKTKNGAKSVCKNGPVFNGEDIYA